VHYRLYHPDDFAQLYAIEKTCFQPPLRFTRRYMGELVSRSNSATWIAEENGCMTGFSVIDIEMDTHGVLGYIQTIEVLPEYRNRGAGAELLQRLEDSARAEKAAMIWLHVDSENHGAIRLYQRHGYLHRGHRAHYYARGRAAEIYVKSLQ
jgi:[ribosomal protein S18]-alanine N-acetyltransferase